MLPKLGTLGTSLHHGRQTPSVPPPFLTGIWLKINHRFPRFQQVSQKVWFLYNTLVSWDKCISAHPGTPFVTLNQTFASNKAFILWTLINSDKRLAVGGSWNPGTSVLIPEGAVLTWHWQVLMDSATFKHCGLDKYIKASLQGSSQ